MMWKRSNAKPLATIPFFNILDKIDNFARMMICCAIPVATNQYIWRKNQINFTLSLVQNWTNFLHASKKNWKWFKHCYDYQRLKNVHRALFRDWGFNYNKILDDCKNCDCYDSKKIQETDIRLFSLIFASAFIIFHSHFWLYIITIIKFIYYNYDFMAKSRFEAMLNIQEKYLIWSYLGVTLSTCNIQDNFCFN